MGQKCNPTGLRIGVIKNWDSRWYAKRLISATLLLKITTFVSTCLKPLRARVFQK